MTKIKREGWTTPMLRRDGIRIERIGGQWVARDYDGKTMGVCPCCAEPFRSAAHVRGTIDMFVPMRGNA